MKQKRRHGLRRRRHREGRTDYGKRLRLLSSGVCRLVMRKSLRNISAQLVEYAPSGDKVVIASSSRELLKHFGWKRARRNIPAAYLTGYLLGKKARKQNLTRAICDTGLHTITKGSILFACLKGALDAGITVPHSTTLFPTQDRLEGKHLKQPPPLQETKARIDAAYKT